MSYRLLLSLTIGSMGLTVVFWETWSLDYFWHSFVVLYWLFLF